MNKFHNILYVSSGLADEADAIKQALSVARNNHTGLHVLIVCPEFPRHMAEHAAHYADYLKESFRKALQENIAVLAFADTSVPVSIEVETGSTPVVRIIRQVLRRSCDLVIKEAGVLAGGKGFEAIDMELLRKCPCPVWLCRPIDRHRADMRVAVAIDPEIVDPAAQYLSLRLLQLSRSLADACSGALDVVSCWDFPFESYLRNRSLNRITAENLQAVVSEAQLEHRTLLSDVLRKSGIGGNLQIHHVRGRPDVAIPQFVETQGIDILVMGTLARTGIPGFTIGNTAENIVQKLGCSLLALKPAGFVSPVQAY